MKLPAEIRIKIFADCVEITNLLGHEKDDFGYGIDIAIDWGYRRYRW